MEPNNIRLEEVPELEVKVGRVVVQLSAGRTATHPAEKTSRSS